MGLAAGLGVTSVVLLLRLSTSGPPGRAPAHPPLLDPDVGLRITLFRMDPSGRSDPPWRVAQSAVGAGEKVFATLADTRNQRAYVAVVLITDSRQVAWLFPPGGPGRQKRSQEVSLVESGWRVPGTVRIPQEARRVVVYALVSQAPVALDSLVRALDQARKTPRFWTRPPRLTVRHSRQTWLALDVLP